MGKTMWFLIKGTFWFSLVLVLLPFLDPEASGKLEGGPKVEIGDTFSAATEAYSYISAICIEKPDVCVKGAETFTALGHRAREGARIAYQFLDTQFAEPTDSVMTGTITPQETVALDGADEAPAAFHAVPQKKPLDLKTALATK